MITQQLWRRYEMDHFAHIEEFFAADPLAGAILVAIIGGIFSLVTSLIGASATITTAYFQHKWHKQHETVTNSTNEIVKRKLDHGRYITDPQGGGEVWQKKGKGT